MCWTLAGAVGLLLAGLGVLYVIFWAIYGIIWLVSNSFFPLPHTVRLGLSAGFLVLMVVSGARQNWAALDPLRQQAELGREMDIKFVPQNWFGIGNATNASKFAVFEARTVAAVGNYILCGGARLLIVGLSKLGRLWRLGSLDVEGCARVIALLAVEAKRQSFAEIVQKVPGLNPVKVFNDLRYIDGLLLLTNEPAGLTLHPELREELSRVEGVETSPVDKEVK